MSVTDAWVTNPYKQRGKKKKDVMRFNEGKKNRLGQVKKGKKNARYGVSW